MAQRNQGMLAGGEETETKKAEGGLVLLGERTAHGRRRLTYTGEPPGAGARKTQDTLQLHHWLNK